MPVFGFAMAVAYGPYMIDGAAAPRFALMAIALPLLLKPVRLTVGHVLGLLWLAYAALAALWSPDGWSAMQHLVYLAMGGLAFCIGGEAASLRDFVRGAALGLGINSLLAIAQVYGYAGVWQGPIPGGLFFNKNHMAEAMALTAIVCLTYRDWTWALACLPGLLLAHCRACDLALGLALVVALWQAERYALASVAGGLGLIGLSMFNDTTLLYRIHIWLPTLAHLSPLGHGLGSFYSQYPSFGPLIDGSRPEYPHNELVYALYELGIGAAPAIALAAWLWLGREWRPFLAATAALCALAFPLQNPFTLLVISLVAGQCAYSRRSFRYIVAKWGVPLYARTARA